MNQVRFNVDRHVVSSSGVEKVIGLWPTLAPSTLDSDVSAETKDQNVEPKEELARMMEEMDANDGDVHEEAVLGDEAAQSGTEPTERSMFSHDEYIDLVRTTGQSINHDYR